MLNVALTGNVAAGKSSVVRWFGKWGATVIDADALVREVQRPGTKTLKDITERFGPGVLRPDGSLDRAALRRVALAEDTALESLSAIVHPAVQCRRIQLMAEAEARGDRIVVHDIPLLFEALEPADFDLVVLVDAPIEVRRQRLLNRGLTPDDADRLIAAQLPAAAKRPRSDIIIDNAGSLDELRVAANRAWREISSMADRSRKQDPRSSRTGDKTHSDGS
jgi:dephospho-CoA kinase